MLYTLSQARDAVKRFVDNGSCSVPLINSRINEALERLTDHVDFECMRATVRISTCKNCFSLPYNVEKLLYADVNGTPAKVFGRPYQFMSSGPGDLDGRLCGSGFRDIVDQGEFPVQFDIPSSYVDGSGETVDLSTTGLRLIAFSTEPQDVGKKLRVRGFKGSGTGDEVNAGRNPGGDLEILHWAQGVEGRIAGFWEMAIAPSEHYYKEITEIIKPETAGYVTVYAVSGSNNTPTNTFFSFLAKLHPLQTIPQFRRYSITNTSAAGASVLALVKLRHVPLVEDDDILPVDSLQAVKLMVMALREENAGNAAGAEVFEGKALAVMLNREKSRTQSDGVPVIFNSEYRTSLGRKLNRRRFIL